MVTSQGLTRSIVVGTLIVLSVIVTLFPFYFMTVTAFKPDSGIYGAGANPLAIPIPTLDHFVFLFTKTAFGNWMINSALIATVSTAISLFCSMLAGYSIARLRFRGASAIGWAIFVTYLIPQTLLFLPMTDVMSRFHLINTRIGLILIYPTFLIPFCTWLMLGYFKGIPRELEEAALIDGASRLQAMVRIVFPLAIPGVICAGLFSFTLSWNEYIYALVFISETTIKTIPIGVPSELMRGDVFYWGELMAGALLGSVPIAVLYSFFVDQFVSGMTAGAVKG